MRREPEINEDERRSEKNPHPSPLPEYRERGQEED